VWERETEERKLQDGADMEVGDRLRKRETTTTADLVVLSLINSDLVFYWFLKTVSGYYWFWKIGYGLAFYPNNTGFKV